MNIRADYNRLKKYISAIFESIGLSREYADIIADNLVTAEMRGMTVEVTIGYLFFSVF